MTKKCFFLTLFYFIAVSQAEQQKDKFQLRAFLYKPFIFSTNVSKENDIWKKDWDKQIFSVIVSAHKPFSSRFNLGIEMGIIRADYTGRLLSHLSERKDDRMFLTQINLVPGYNVLNDNFIKTVIQGKIGTGIDFNKKYCYDCFDHEIYHSISFNMGVEVSLLFSVNSRIALGPTISYLHTINKSRNIIQLGGTTLFSFKN